MRDRAEQNEWVIRTHRHPLLHQFLLVQEGCFSMWLDDTRHDVSNAVLLNIPKDHVHGFRFQHGMHGYVLSLPAEELPGICHNDDTVLKRLASPAVAPATDALASVFRRLHDWHKSSSPVRIAMLRALGCEIACLAADQLLHRDVDGVSGRQNLMIEAFEALVADNLRKRWRVGDYASALGISSAHLSRLCRRYSGVSASEWIDRAVMMEACRELAYTIKPVQQIAYDLGYDDPSHFSRVFRRVLRKSPSEYRG
nr:AraC family transcriptional regulator [Roseivivax halodurans]